MTTSIATAALLACAASGVSAQTANQSDFVGPAIGVAVSAVQHKIDYVGTFAPLNGQSTQTNNSDTSLLASWGFAMTPDWVMTLGLSYGLNSADTGSIAYTFTGAQTLTTKVKEHVAVSMAPGYRVGSSALVYGKLSYHQIKAEYTDTLTGSGSITPTGTGVGFGAAFALAPHLELRTEYEAVNYDAKTVNLTSVTTKQTALNVGLLYKF